MIPTKYDKPEIEMHNKDVFNSPSIPLTLEENPLEEQSDFSDSEIERQIEGEVATGHGVAIAHAQPSDQHSIVP